MKKIAVTLFLILLTFLVSRYIFEPMYLYHEIPLLDIPMHIWGGFLIGNVFVAFSLYKKITFPTYIFIIYVTCIIVAWEVYENVRGVVNYTTWYGYFDTIKDTILGFAGAFFARNRS